MAAKLLMSLAAGATTKLAIWYGSLQASARRPGRTARRPRRPCSGRSERGRFAPFSRRPTPWSRSRPPGRGPTGRLSAALSSRTRGQGDGGGGRPAPVFIRFLHISGTARMLREFARGPLRSGTAMQLGFVSAILGDLSLEQVLAFAAGRGLRLRRVDVLAARRRRPPLRRRHPPRRDPLHRRRRRPGARAARASTAWPSPAWAITPTRSTPTRSTAASWPST